MENLEAAKGFRWIKSNGVQALACVALEQAGFTNAFSTRTGGVSPMPSDALNLAGFNDDAADNIHENRRRFLSLFQGERRMATVFQVHGCDVHNFDANDAREHVDNDEARCDAMTIDARRAPDVLLAVKTADCVPVLIGDTRNRAAAAIHAGWRGTVARIVERTLERMSETYGTRPADCIAAIGPAALACCYEVGAEVVTAFQNEFKDDAAKLFIPTRPGHSRISLQQANADQLAVCGLDRDNIHLAPFCTMHRNDLFFSYRREKLAHGRVGRLMAVIGSGQKKD